MIPTPTWKSEHFESARLRAIELFREQRLCEPVEAYHDAFDEYQGVFEELLEATVDFANLRTSALDVLTDDRLLEAFRYIAGPPISADDLKTLAETVSLNPKRFHSDADLVSRVVDIVRDSIDRRRFPWLTEGREPTETEKSAAVLASAALLATRRLETARRTEAKKAQEQAVEDALAKSGLTKVRRQPVATQADAPDAGQFCREAHLGGRKADLILRLWDNRLMPIECKVSNSSTNSIKRLNNDAAAKAEAWREDFGQTQVVPVAILSGVYRLPNLEDAQRRGLTIFWAHQLDALLKWIERTRPNKN